MLGNPMTHHMFRPAVSLSSTTFAALFGPRPNQDQCQVSRAACAELTEAEWRPVVSLTIHKLMMDVVLVV